jgi:uncharacterized protein YndB with AHSA1/START domain
MNPASEGKAIVQEITIDAPAERIFDAPTNPGERVESFNISPIGYVRSAL